MVNDGVSLIIGIYQVGNLCYGLLFPFFITQVLPAGDLGEYQKTQAVAFIDKVMALGVMGGSNGVAAQFLLQNASILALVPV